MATFNPYLNVAGNTEEAFCFYKSVFGAEFAALRRFKETPVSDRVPAKEKEQIMHVSLPIGEGNVLVGADALESMGHKLTIGNNFHISIDTDSKEEAGKLFNGLSAGGKVEQSLRDTFWGSYFGMVTDKFGIGWMVKYTYPKPK